LIGLLVELVLECKDDWVRRLLRGELTHQKLRSWKSSNDPPPPIREKGRSLDLYEEPSPDRVVVASTRWASWSFAPIAELDGMLRDGPIG